MARIRTIKPEFPQSESMGRVSREARLLFIMLWTIADDSGKARAASRMLASLLFPYDDDAKKHIGGWLAELSREQCIRLFEVDGASYLQIENWLDHQKIDKPSKSRLPDAPSGDFANVREASMDIREASATDLVPSTLDLVPRTNKSIDQPRASRFGEFWTACPKKVGKGKAGSLFDKASRETSPDLLITAMRRYAAAQAGKDPNYIAHPATWLSQRRWEDEDVSGQSNGSTGLFGLEAQILEAQRIEEEEQRQRDRENVH